MEQMSTIVPSLTIWQEQEIKRLSNIKGPFAIAAIVGIPHRYVVAVIHNRPLCARETQRIIARMKREDPKPVQPKKEKKQVGYRLDPEPEVAPIIRPIAVYSNKSRDQYISELLNS